ncbi:keratin, type I cytoskeletal 9-like [Mercenaria mercenaria]|uniref:keratin, type I cytoskeletal 9-like n=1 Tax=Mercenaria mercenaria TaxID=6596 RepID=UPI00234EB14F|nr:keratin, type I cytoskeletal 9-like [Mercenaria mercenaria]
MTPFGVSRLCFIIVILVQGNQAIDCLAYKSGNAVTIPQNIECTLSSDLDADTIVVSGTITITMSAEIIATTIDIQAGGKIAADAVVSGGTGKGNAHGSGGGHGGRGGSPANNFLASSDAIAYGDIFNYGMYMSGSEGGGTGAGLGGGFIHIGADDVTVNGILSANGGDATGSGGGGSGGNVMLDIHNSFSGSGVILARGGDGSGGGGGGGGGRISIAHHQTPSFTGDIFADGGLGGTTETTLSASGSSMSSSSRQSSNPDSYGYLGHHNSKSWRPSTYAGSYLEMSLGTESYVTAIKTKGGSGYYVETYTVRFYNATSSSWVCY